MAKTIMALFKKQKTAERAVKKLGEMGFTSDDLRIVTRFENIPAALLEDADIFREGLREGGALVIAEAEEVQAYTVAELFENEGAQVEERDLEIERVVAETLPEAEEADTDPVGAGIASRERKA